MVKCLRNGVGKRVSGCAPHPGRPELVVSGRPSAAGRKNRVATAHFRAGGCILQPTGKP